VQDDPRKWTKGDLDELIKAERAESLTLDYKKSGALSKNPEARAELAKDVSALANSAGGTLVYGMTEKNRIATGFDEGVDTREISVEWIQNVVYGKVEPRIEGLDVHPYPIAKKRVGYVAYVPQSRTAHMTERSYWRRVEGQNVAMDDYEVRDVMRRGVAPDVRLRLRGHPDSFTSEVFLEIRNLSPTPAPYFALSFFLSPGVTLPRFARATILSVGNFQSRPRTLVVEGVSQEYQEWRHEWWDRIPLFESQWAELTLLQFTFNPGGKILWLTEGPNMRNRGAYRVAVDIQPLRLEEANIQWDFPSE